MKRINSLLLVAVVLASSCMLERINPFDLAGGENPDYVEPVIADVEFSLAEGTYEGAQEITLSCPTDQATIRYTTDGSDPSRTAGTPYASAITLYADATVKAVAYREDYPASSDTAVASRAYTLTNVVAPVAFSLDSGTYEGDRELTLGCATSLAKIRYTTDGSDPSRAVGTIYASAITLSQDTTVKAVAYREDYPSSTDASSSREYTIVYVGWRIASWTEAAGALGDPAVLTDHGVPQTLVMDSVGNLHLLCIDDVAPLTWWYSSKAAASSTFSAYVSLGTDVYAGSVGAAVVTANTLYAVWADRGAGTTFDLVSAAKSAGGWAAPITLYSYDAGSLGAGMRAYPSVFLFSSDALKPRIFYWNGTDLVQTLQNGAAIVPDPPGILVAGVTRYAMAALGLDDAALAYVDTLTGEIRYRTYGDATTQTVWTPPDATVDVYSLTVLVDAAGGPTIVAQTYDSTDDTDRSAYALRSFSRDGGTWAETGAIAGTAASGPSYSFPHAAAFSTDLEGIQHLHMAYTEVSGVMDYRIRYAVFDNGAWQLASEPLYTGGNGVAPSMVADSAGNLHVVFSFMYTDNTRDLAYCVGSPAEPQQ